MLDNPVNLDSRRSSKNKMAANIRRQSQRAIESDQAAFLRREEDLERQRRGKTATNWSEAAAKARYLIRRYADTADGLVPGRQKLIQLALADLARLADDVKSGQ